MNEWKELKIDNLPSDILTGDYEFLQNEMALLKTKSRIERIEMIGTILKGYKYKYRKTIKKAPTHEEIMTKWWKVSNGWWMVESYSKENYVTSYYYYIKKLWVDKEWFIGRESVDIPPEQ